MEMSTPRSPRKWTLASLVTAWQDDRHSIEQALAKLAPPPPPFTVVKEGQRIHRTDATDKGGRVHESFCHPSLGLPYAILSVTYRGQPEDFMFHPGEEILIPIHGKVGYSIFWRPDAAKGDVRVASVERPSIIRINPQLPHHIFAPGSSEAKAWIIFRDVGDSVAAIVDEPRAQRPARKVLPAAKKGNEAGARAVRSATKKAAPQNRVRLDELRDPARYGLIAWGVAQAIQRHREHAHMRVTELAKACEIDASHLSRVESMTANVSLDTLSRIASVLHVKLTDLILPPTWREPWLVDTKTAPRDAEWEWPLCPEDDHSLHVTRRQISRDAPIGKSGPGGLRFGSDPAPLSTWIVLKGAVIFEIETAERMLAELLQEHSVIHFLRGHAPTKLSAHTPTAEVLWLQYSRHCPAHS
jgi:transcriptional regulator with XRE-family HTH domain